MTADIYTFTPAAGAVDLAAMRRRLRPSRDARVNISKIRIMDDIAGLIADGELQAAYDILRAADELVDAEMERALARMKIEESDK